MRGWRGLAAALTAAVALAACTTATPPDTAASESAGAAGTAGATTSTAPTPAPSPDPAPKVGQCHRLDFARALDPAAETNPSPCRKPHTSQTYFVGSLELDPTVRVDSPGVARRVSRTCTERLSRHVSASPRDLRTTMIRPLWFTPSLAQADLGAHWFRCDVVVVAEHETLWRLPARTARLARLEGVAMCGTARPGAPRFARVACARPHSWRAVTSVDLPGAAWPSARAAQEAMSDACRNAAADRAEDPLNLVWAEERPTRAQWRAGQRYGLCWTPAG